MFCGMNKHQVLTEHQDRLTHDVDLSEWVKWTKFEVMPKLFEKYYYFTLKCEKADQPKKKVQTNQDQERTKWGGRCGPNKDEGGEGKTKEPSGGLGSNMDAVSTDDRWSQVSVMTSEWERSCICMVEEILFPQKVSSWETGHGQWPLSDT